MAGETRFLTRQPPQNVATKGGLGAGSGFMLIDMTHNVYLLFAEGTPVNGAQGTGGGWAGIGSEYTNVLTGFLYKNQGTKAAPNWVQIA